MTAYNFGHAIGALMIPAIGLILLIVGFVQRTRSQQQSPPMPVWYPGQIPPGEQPQPPFPAPPPGYGPQAPPGSALHPPPTGAPYYPRAGQWPPPRPKPRGTGLIVTGAVILTLGLIGGLVRAAGSSDTSAVGSLDSINTPGRLDSAGELKVGECVADSDFGEGDPKPTDCSNPRAVMELASHGGANAACPDGNGRDDTDYTTLFWENATMCFAANLTEGNCYAVNTVDTSEAPFTYEECADPRAQVKVVRRIDGTTDAAQCPASTKPISYVQPARLYCLQAAR